MNEVEKNEEKEVKEEIKQKRRGRREVEFDKDAWKPRTELGKKVKSGEITDIDEILDSGKNIMEAEIVDVLVPNLESEIVLIGGSAGKGGGKRRTPSKRRSRG